MLRNQSSTSVSPELDRLISEMIRDDAKFVAKEMRSVHRETLVVPVTIVFKDGSMQCAFSRNISPAGVCLIGKESVPTNETADLEIYRLGTDVKRIVAEARWCKPFGEEYFASGWKFIRVRK